MRGFTITEPLVAVIDASPGRGHDRAGAVRTATGYLLVLADGAGGTTGGAEAASRVVARALAERPRTASACVALLASLDDRLGGGGETTAVVLAVVDGVVLGASVGDSGAWMPRGKELVDLTENQRRKPLLGSGRATVVAIDPVPLAGRLLVASDGLSSYVQSAQILEILALPFADIPSALTSAARLPSGALQDDLSIVVAEVVART